MGLVFSTACVLACYLYLTTEHRRADKNVTSAFSSCYDTSLNKESINPSSSFRSRHDKFLASQLAGVKSRTQKNHRRAREREPSRLPLKQLSGVLKKTRKLRQLVRKVISKNFPKSSSIHMYTSVAAFQRMNMYKPYQQFNAKGHIRMGCRKKELGRCNSKLRRSTKVKNSRKDFGVYKSLNHRSNYSKILRSGDIETNPGP